MENQRGKSELHDALDVSISLRMTAWIWYLRSMGMGWLHRARADLLFRVLWCAVDIFDFLGHCTPASDSAWASCTPRSHFEAVQTLHVHANFANNSRSVPHTCPSALFLQPTIVYCTVLSCTDQQPHQQPCRSRQPTSAATSLLCWVQREAAGAFSSPTAYPSRLRATRLPSKSLPLASSSLGR